MPLAKHWKSSTTFTSEHFRLLAHVLLRVAVCVDSDSELPCMHHLHVFPLPFLHSMAQALTLCLLLPPRRLHPSFLAMKNVHLSVATNAQKPPQQLTLLTSTPSNLPASSLLPNCSLRRSTLRSTARRQRSLSDTTLLRSADPSSKPYHAVFFHSRLLLCGLLLEFSAIESVSRRTRCACLRLAQTLIAPIHR